MAHQSADQQADTGAAPYDAYAGRSAVEHNFAEKAKQDLCRTAAAGPSDADQGDAEDERMRAHVAETFGVFMPGPDHMTLRNRAAVGPETAPGVG